MSANAEVIRRKRTAADLFAGEHCALRDYENAGRYCASAGWDERIVPVTEVGAYVLSSGLIDGQGPFVAVLSPTGMEPKHNGSCPHGYAPEGCKNVGSYAFITAETLNASGFD